MPSPFQAIDVANTALQAYQRALDVTSNNIANVNTPGYTRQVAALASQVPSTFYSMNGQHSLGNGVGVASVYSMRDMFLQGQLTSVTSDLGNSGAQLQSSQQVQAIFNDTSGKGISTALDAFFNSWSGLSSDPSSTALRTQVQQSGSTLATDIRSAYANLDAIKQQSTSDIKQTLANVQTLANQIGTLNKEILQQSTNGAQPNELIDQRNQAIQQLSQLVPTNTQTFGNGAVAVYVGQFTLVDPLSGANTFPTTFDATAGTVSDANGTYPISNGQLAGQFISYQQVAGVETQLDNLANNLRTSVNTLHKTGTTGLGTTGQNFFNDSNPQTGAIDFNLDPAVAANPAAIAAGTSGASGDGGLALSISEIQNQAQASLGSVTASNYYQNLVGTIGVTVQTNQNLQNTQNSLSSQINNQIQSVSGVSLDDEMTSMVKFQRAYQAAAQVLNIANQNIQSLLNMVQ